jgi:TolB protein
MEQFDAEKEAIVLRNIKQVTFPSMGFEKAGEAYFSPDGKSIIFQAVPKGQRHYQIYIMNLREGKPRMVSTGRGACTCAYFRPDGKKIIFASSHEDPQLVNENNQAVPGYKREGGNYEWEFTPYMNIYEANPDGSDLKALTSGKDYHAECAYSPDGKHIVFTSNKTGSMNLYIMDSDGTNVKQVTNTAWSYNGGPFFYPDGSKIIFRADREKRHYLQLYVINADGTGEQKLTNNQAVNWAPFWYSNGEVIAFTTSLHGHMHYEIYALNIRTGKQYRVTHNKTFDGLPAFSRDGRQMLWTSKRGSDGTCQLFIADFVLPKELK